jgi:hypothetical protein
MKMLDIIMIPRVQWRQRPDGVLKISVVLMHEPIDLSRHACDTLAARGDLHGVRSTCSHNLERSHDTKHAYHGFRTCLSGENAEDVSLAAIHGRANKNWRFSTRQVLSIIVGAMRPMALLRLPQRINFEAAKPELSLGASAGVIA